MKNLIYTLIFVTSLAFAQIVEKESKNSADCLILQDENSIICKYIHERSQEDKDILVQWINPQGKISRQRTLIIPAGHGSIYDFRYIEGRMKGIWQFKVIDQKIETIANFLVE